MSNNKNNILKDLPIVILGFIIAAVAIYFIINILNKEGKQPLVINNILKTENNEPAAKDGDDNVADEILNNNQEAIAKAQKNAAANSEIEVTINLDGHIRGNADALVKIIVYSDFACPFCADFSDTIKKIIEEFGEKITVEYRHFPLNFHAQAIPAALASECADEQGKFWEMHDKLFADNKDGLMNTEIYQEDAKELGLNASKFNKCLESEKYKDKVLAQMAEGEKAGVAGVPASFVNAEKVDGAVPFADFKHSDGQDGEGMKNIILRHLNDK